MKSVKIRLSTIADVRDFVNIVAKSDVDIDLASGQRDTVIINKHN